MKLLRDRRVRFFIYTLIFLMGFVVLVFTSLASDGSALRGTGRYGVSGSAITDEVIRNFPEGKIGLLTAIPALRVVPMGNSRFDDLARNLIRFQLEDFGFILIDKDPTRDACTSRQNPCRASLTIRSRRSMWA